MVKTTNQCVYIYMYTHEYTNRQFVSGHPKAQMPRISDGQAKISEAVTKRPLVEWALGLGGQGILYIIYIYTFYMSVYNCIYIYNILVCLRSYTSPKHRIC